MKKAVWLEEFLEHLNYVQDDREDWKVLHKMGDIIGISLFAMLANCDKMSEIHIWAKLNYEILKKYLELPNGLPSYDTMRRVMAIITPTYMNNILQEWNKIVANNAEKLRKILAIDGKTECGNTTSAQKPNHIVSAVDEYGLCFGQEVVDVKSNEITAIPKLLDRLDIKNQIITTDAMGTQKDIARKIKAGKGDYLLALKGNQHNFYNDVALWFENFAVDCEYARKIEKARNGMEKREYWQTTDIKWLYQKDKWSGLKSLAMTKNTITRDGKTTVETRYFISSLEQNVELVAHAIRKHWMVESFHWHLDVTMREDDNMMVDKRAALNLNILRKIVLSILKAAEHLQVGGGRKTSLKARRLIISCNPVKFLEDIFKE